MNRTDHIHWGVFEARGLAVTSHYGLGVDWVWPQEKVASVSDTDAKVRQVTTRDRQEHQNPTEATEARVQDFEKRDLAVRRPPAGASADETEATSEAFGAAA